MFRKNHVLGKKPLNHLALRLLPWALNLYDNRQITIEFFLKEVAQK